MVGSGSSCHTAPDWEIALGDHRLATNQVQICIRNSKGEYMFFRHLQQKHCNKSNIDSLFNNV